MEKYPYIFFGNEPIGPLALEVLRKAHYEPVRIIDDPKMGLDEQLLIVEECQPTFFLVVGYGAILKKPLLETVAGQVLNIHPSLLPEYRGPAPVVQAILDGATETGVTLMEIDDQMDHGNIIAQEAISLRGNELPSEIYAVLVQKGVELFLNNYQEYIEENSILTPQNHSMATFTHFIKKGDGLLDLNADPTINERKVRAFEKWPRTWVNHRGKRLIVEKAHIEKESDKEFLKFDIVQPEGKKSMKFSEYCNGLRMKEEDVYNELLHSTNKV